MKTILFLIFLSSPFSFAGNEVGNGGDLLKCPNKPLVLFDFAEDSFKKMDALKKNAELNEYKIVESLIAKIKDLSPAIFKKYSNDLASFPKRIKFIKGEVFRDIEDSKHVSLPKDCELLQVAIQQIDPLTKDTVIAINKDLYDQLDPVNKAGLILHEIIYEHFKFYGVTNSVEVRIFNRYLHSLEVKSGTNKEFNDFLERIAIPSY
ncbi:MAG: hypothetical protein K9K67_11775 [Bacteriovoracaceae bacterium]|nr:hypothetical protein [Bacteriovoracaceae bacterium]